MENKKCAWSRTSEALLLELVREKRFLWDPKDPVYHKTKLRQEAFRSIAEALTLQCPELNQPNGDQVRLKFKNLRTYFLNQHRKIRDAPSGSAGCPGVKWPLYDAATYLLDAQVDLTPGKSTFVLPSNMGEDSDASLVQEVNFGEGCLEDGIILEEQLTGPGEENQLYSPASALNFESPASSLTVDENQFSSTSSPLPTPPLARLEKKAGNSESITSPSSLSRRRKRTSKTSDPVDASLAVLSNYFENRQSSSDIAVNMGRLVESVADKMPFDKQLKLLTEISKVIERVNGNDSGNSEG